jgi:glycosyltransferase involved in cell wall biosynthesis
VHPLTAAAGAKGSFATKLGCWARGRSELLERRWLPQTGIEARDLIKLVRPDCIVADSTFVLPVLPQRLPVPLLLHLHNVESALLGRRDDLRRPPGERLARRIESVAIARIEAAAARRARLTVTVSELDRQRILGLTPDARAVAIENSVDCDRIVPLPPPPPDRPPVLLFLGTFDYPPNLEAARDLITRHLPLLRTAWPQLEVRLVGLDSHRQLERFRDVPGVRLSGRVEDVRPQYEQCTAVYLPIHSGGGTRIKVLEAFAHGRPVLSTQVGVEGLGLMPDTHYLPFETPAEGLAALRRLESRDPRPMLAAARSLVEQRYSHRQTQARLAELLADHFNRVLVPVQAVAPPLSRAVRAFSTLVGRPIGILFLLGWRMLH